MILPILVIALIFALVFSLIFSVGLRRSGPWPNFWIFFLIVFLTILTGGIWIIPVGPAVWGVYWVPMLFIAIIISLLLAAATPKRRPRTRAEAIKQAEDEQDVEAVIGIFFWILIIAFVGTIVLRLF
jgi:uncharacterized membrane protein